jgi:hypothetical protein
MAGDDNIMKHMRIGALIILGLQLWTGHGIAVADEASVVVGAEQRQHLGLTLYQNGLALVDERRAASLPENTSSVVLAATSPHLIPGSARILAPGLALRALDYRLHHLSRQTLLMASVGKHVGVIQTHPATGEKSVVSAEVVSVTGGILLRMDGHLVTGDPDLLVFKDIPAALLQSPAIAIMVNPGAAYDGEIGLRYLTDGLGWRADHTAQVNETSSGITLDLESWASIENNTGLRFGGASLAMVAGSVNRMASPQPQPMMRMETMALSMADAPSVGGPSREALGDFHLYTAPGTFDLGPGARVQILLNTQKGVAAEKAYVLSGHGHAYFGRMPNDQASVEHPQILYRFTNSGREPIAAGTMRIYGDSRFLGEDHLTSTAAGERAELHAGQAFDLSARRRQLGFKRGGDNNTVFETSHEITLRNAGAKAATMEIREPASGEWKILESSHKNSRDGMTAVWKIDVPASGEIRLTYRIRIKR